jgi:hypothetical protein
MHLLKAMLEKDGEKRKASGSRLMLHGEINTLWNSM